MSLTSLITRLRHVWKYFAGTTVEGHEQETRDGHLPDTNDSLVLRTDFSDEAAWARICREIETPVDGFRAYVSFLSDPTFEGLSVGELTSLGRHGPYRTFLFVVDQVTMTDPEHPILVLDLVDEPGRTFRVTPHEMQSVQNNLAICNMDFRDFAESVDPDGIFRGFPDV